ncbi:hypothetical protein CPB83DRAFT_863593 [Crepidotus variabilis]|uniref:Glycoside hydrolase family 31 TIM barrel domain-containing protein n=1 Tax=Crepidotus variabilis TaxID=179855 RepID=A0A9P6E5T9_9AGAR|nr:hypothetical protein CPB83DRAFT_863593 [Crepidotus variabilis]
MLGFASLYQVPMIGRDVRGFDWNTDENICVCWTILGAFNPFMRNHNTDVPFAQDSYLR